MNQKKIGIATSQFPVSSNVDENREYILAQMKEAKSAGCDLIHFPEGALSGYAGIDFESFDNFDWASLKISTKQILQSAKELNIWVILGSSHPLSGSNKPHNSIYIINNSGQIIDRYDKLFCAGEQDGSSGDLLHYSPGGHFSIFEINGIRCGTLICHDYRYPELYRELKKNDVQLVFHSFHAGNMNAERQQMMEEQVGYKYHRYNPGKTYPEITMPASMIAYASNNYVWISCSNTSAKESCWGSFAVRPDGVIIGQLRKNEAGFLTTTIALDDQYYDSTVDWRKRAMNGIYHSGELIDDPRSKLRHKL